MTTTTMRRLLVLRPSTSGGSPRRQRRECPLVAAFFSSLADGLAQLDGGALSDGGGGGVVSVRWCADAMRLVKRMQRDLLAVFRSSDDSAPEASFDGAGDGEWLERYMEETAALLDLCNALKSAAARLRRCCMLVDHFAGAGAGGGEDGPYAASLAALCDGCPPEAETSERLMIRRKVISSSSARDATLVAGITMAVVSTSVLNALTGGGAASHRPSSSTSSSTLAAIDDEVPEQLRPWRDSLSAISDRLLSSTSPAAAIAELESVAAAAKDMVAKGETVNEERAEVLARRSGELRAAVETLGSVVDQVFDEAIRGRNEMLGILRDKALSHN